MGVMDAPCIKKLDINVVNRIAAGEIIQSPANALKELLENSIDAKSTFIQITVKSGGLKFLQIQDNGTGIRKEDLAIVCERFTTSKLEKFEDLSNISTYGFRGEALASISHIAHLSIQTKTSKDQCAYKATYENGKLKEIPKPCAGNQGTIITVEDLFFSLPQRIKTIKSPSEEFQKILDVTSKYAVHNSHIGFTLKNSNANVLRTSPKSTKSDNIKIVYGSQIHKHLMEIEYQNENLNFKMTGLITNVNYSSQKNAYLIFLNNRLIESAALKAVIEEIYSMYLQKGHHPFIYISLELKPSVVDVNIHPTKHEVKFLNEDEVMKSIKLQIENKLNCNKSSKILYKQSRLSVFEENENEGKKGKVKENCEKLYAKDVIRIDSREQKLEKFFPSTASKVDCGLSESFMKFKRKSDGVSNLSTEKKETKLTSVLNMKQSIEDSCSTQLRKILKEMAFIGIIDKKYSLFQFQTKLFLCDTTTFSRELFYQLLIYNFENFDKFTFKVPMKIDDLSMIALECKESGWTIEDGPKNILANRITKILIEKEAIMREYFGLNINKEGYLETIPILLENYIPSMSYLPLYILRLATEVDWETEEQCFETFCRETADYYSRVSEFENEMENYKWTVEHIIYPALRNNLLPKNTLKNHLFELASLPNLYKVFERC